MDTVRTTITLPAELHEKLRLLSIKEKKSLGELVEEKFKTRKSSSRMDIEKRLQRDLRLFQATARSSKVNIDAVRAVREERNRDDI